MATFSHTCEARNTRAVAVDQVGAGGLGPRGGGQGEVGAGGQLPGRRDVLGRPLVELAGLQGVALRPAASTTRSASRVVPSGEESVGVPDDYPEAKREASTGAALRPAMLAPTTTAVLRELVIEGSSCWLMCRRSVALGACRGACRPLATGWTGSVGGAGELPGLDRRGQLGHRCGVWQRRTGPTGGGGPAWATRDGLRGGGGPSGSIGAPARWRRRVGRSSKTTVIPPMTSLMRL